MLPLTEDLAKNWLRGQGLPVPSGTAAAGVAEAQAIVAAMPDGAVVKALIPTGRRGKAGAVIVAQSAEQGAAAAEKLLGSDVNGHTVGRVYVEEKVAIREEYYFSLSLDGARPELLLTRRGGVDIEEVTRSHPDELVRASVDPLRGLSAEEAQQLVARGRFPASVESALAALLPRLYAAFCAADALLLEINPLALDESGALMLVGAMMGIDEAALFRHSMWMESALTTALPGNLRERSVAIANREIPGGECQYVELAGDIGLLVGGGGAGLYQHDLMLELGGKPANHCVTPPTGTDNRKLKAVLNAILGNPRLKGLLLGFNFSQMARCDIRARTLVEVLREKGMDKSPLPIVVRLFGAGEEEARAVVADFPNIHYMPRGATLKDAVRRIVDLSTA